MTVITPVDLTTSNSSANERKLQAKKRNHQRVCLAWVARSTAGLV